MEKHESIYLRKRGVSYPVECSLNTNMREIDVLDAEGQWG